MQTIDNYYLKGVRYHINTKLMSDLKANFYKVLPIINTTSADHLNSAQNHPSYPNSPAMPDDHIISLALLQEVLSIDSEHLFLCKLQMGYTTAFPNLSRLNYYYRRPKRLAESIETLTRSNEDTFIMNSIPRPIAHIAYVHSTSVCREHAYSTINKRCSALTDQYYIGYKLHMVVSLNGVYQCIDLSKASVNDLRYLKGYKGSILSNCLLLADKGYLSAHQQIDLFYRAEIELQTPKRRNQANYRPWHKIFKTARQRIETVFSQLCEQIMLKHNYEKSFADLRSRMISKVFSFTLLQYINWQNKQPINHIKYALGA